MHVTRTRRPIITRSIPRYRKVLIPTGRATLDLGDFERVVPAEYQERLVPSWTVHLHDLCEVDAAALVGAVPAASSHSATIVLERPSGALWCVEGDVNFPMLLLRLRELGSAGEMLWRKLSKNGPGWLHDRERSKEIWYVA